MTNRRTFPCLITIDPYIGASVIYGLIEIEAILKEGAKARGYGEVELVYLDKPIDLTDKQIDSLSAHINIGNKENSNKEV